MALHSLEDFNLKFALYLPLNNTVIVKSFSFTLTYLKETDTKSGIAVKLAYPM